jgi:hypothetical protein
VANLNSILDNGGLVKVTVFDIAQVTEVPSPDDTEHPHCSFKLVTNHNEMNYDFRTLTINGSHIWN